MELKLDREERIMQLFYPYVCKEAIKAVGKTLESGWVATGPKVAEFERAFADYVGAKYAVALNSCTAALHLALIEAGVGNADEVITTPMTFVSTNEVILYQEAIPVFCDVDYDTMCIDPANIERLITKKTKAIMIVHFAGRPCDLKKIKKIAKKHNITLIQDCAHACGSEYKEKKIGHDSLCCFSFHALKNLVIGDGGMITTNSSEQYNRLLGLRWMGINKDTWARTESVANGQGKYSWNYDVPSIGYKYHMCDILASIGLEQLKHLDKYNARRREIAELYHKELESFPDVNLPPEDNCCSKSSWSMYVIKARDESHHPYNKPDLNRNGLQEFLQEKNIQTSVHYFPNHLLSIFADYKKKLPFAEGLFSTILSLPMHLKLTNKDVKYVCKCIKEFYK